MPTKIKKKIILLFGTTASGKSRLASDIAKEYNGEIINADSMQVYKEVKILSARPNTKNIKHHLYGFLSVKRNFSTGSWYKLASKKIREINKKGKIALVVGGTGLYFKALTNGLSEIPAILPVRIYINPEKKTFTIAEYHTDYNSICVLAFGENYTTIGIES